VDTFTHGILGAAASQAIFGKTLPRSAGLIGFAAGVAPDLDLFLGSATDPVATILYHRQFTHSLIFIPLGALLVALLCLWMKSLKGVRFTVYGAAFIGYGLHGLLDACTSYGTLLWWPFSYQRVAWDIIAIVDPLFSLMLLGGLLWAVIGRRPWPARLAVCGAVIYLGFGIWQLQRATTVQDQLAAARGHVIEHRRVMPLPGSLASWRAVYLASGHIYVDGVRVPWWNSALVKPGGATRLASFDLVPQAVAEHDGTRRVFEVFAWFADGFIAPVDGMAATIGDMRYAAEASSLTPLWGMQFDAHQVNGPTRWRSPDSRRTRIVTNIWRALIADHRDYRLVNDVLDARPR
jgi:inner membrane protein